MAPLYAGPSDPVAARAAWSALGSTVVLQVADPAAARDARAVVEAELAAIDLACSRFRDDSDLMRINAHAGRAVRVCELCVEAVEAAVRAAQLTSGAVDPALGHELVLAGYDRDIGLLDRAPGVPGGPHDASAPQRRLRGVSVRGHSAAGWRTITVDRTASTVGVGRGVSLDLGATAKALAADRAARAAHAVTGSGVLVSLGGDIAVAGAPPPEGWLVFVTDDHRSGLDAGGELVSIRDGGLATSSTLARRWTHAGRTMHHIIDPATGDPTSEVWSTVSVAAATCLDANIASTAALVQGAAAVAWLSLRRLPARLVAPSGNVVRIGGWPAPDAGPPARG